MRAKSDADSEGHESLSQFQNPVHSATPSPSPAPPAVAAAAAAGGTGGRSVDWSDDSTEMYFLVL